MKLTDVQLLNDALEPVCAGQVVESDMIPDGPALGERPDLDCVHPNADLSFVPYEVGVVTYFVRRGPSPQRVGEDGLEEAGTFDVTEGQVGSKTTIFGVVRYDYNLSTNPEVELVVEFGGTWLMFAPIVLR